MKPGIATRLDGDQLLNDPEGHGRWWVQQFFPNGGRCPRCNQAVVEHVMGGNKARCPSPGCYWRGTNQDAREYSLTDAASSATIEPMNEIPENGGGGDA